MDTRKGKKLPSQGIRAPRDRRVEEGLVPATPASTSYDGHQNTEEVSLDGRRMDKGTWRKKGEDGSVERTEEEAEGTEESGSGYLEEGNMEEAYTRIREMVSNSVAEGISMEVMEGISEMVEAAFGSIMGLLEEQGTYTGIVEQLEEFLRSKGWRTPSSQRKGLQQSRTTLGNFENSILIKKELLSQLGPQFRELTAINNDLVGTVNKLGQELGRYASLNVGLIRERKRTEQDLEREKKEKSGLEQALSKEVEARLRQEREMERRIEEEKERTRNWNTKWDKWKGYN